MDRDQQGWTPAMWACMNGLLDVLKYVVSELGMVCLRHLDHEGVVHTRIPAVNS